MLLLLLILLTSCSFSAGPWTLDPAPIFEEDGGHPMVFRDFDGTLRLVFHQPNHGFSHPVILPVEDNGKTLTIQVQAR